MKLTELREVADVISGQHVLEPDHNNIGKGIGYLTGPSDFGPLYPTISRWTEKPGTTCRPDDVLVTVKGAGVGKINFAPDTSVAIGRQLMAVRCKEGQLDRDFLFCWLHSQSEHFKKQSVGATVPGLSREDLECLVIDLPEFGQQRQIAARLKAQLTEVESARRAAQAQVREVSRLADAIILDSVRSNPVAQHSLGKVLTEVKQGIGPCWAEYPVLGATRAGLAPAKEAPGKHAPKYKPAFPGTVFYNPMRILIGSIAFVDDDDAPGITSPDYVVLQGKPDLVDSCWFYYWLRSPLGVDCINSLARGAVRERMLFNRLAEGVIDLPDFTIQQKAAAALKELKPVRLAIEKQLAEIQRLPQRILAQAFAEPSP